MTKRYKLVFVLYCCFITSLTGQSFDQLDINQGLQASGSISTSNIAYFTSGESRRDPLSSYLTGNLNLSLFNYSMPFSFSYSNRQTNFTQPFNHFRFEPSYKWVKLYLGTAGMSFSNYTLSGHLFNGAGVELTPDKWEISAMYGVLKKAVEPDFEAESHVEPAFKRVGYGLKVGYSDSWGRVGVNVFSAKDDAGSLKMVTPDMQIDPLNNVAVGINARKTFFNRYYADAEYSFSVMQQLNNPFARADTTVFDPSENDVATSKRYDAINAAVGYQGDIFSIAVRYERVAPGYMTLGAYYFNNDMQNITLAPAVRIMQGKMQISTNAGLQQNNLDGENESATNRLVGSFNVAYNPGEKWSLSTSYSNFSSYTRYRMTPDPYFRDELDSLNFYQINQTLNGNVGYTFGNDDVRHSINGNISYQQSYERQEANRVAGLMDMYGGAASYTYSIAPSSISLTVGANYNLNETPELRTTFVGPSANVSKGIFDNQLRASAGATYNHSNTHAEGNTTSFSTVNGQFGLTYTPKSEKESLVGHHAGLSGNYLQRFGSQRFGEFTVTINYTMSFK